MNNQARNSPAQDFSNEVLDVVKQAERDQVRTQIRQELQDLVLKFCQRVGNFEDFIKVSEVYPVTTTLEASYGNFKGELTVTVSRTNGVTVLETVQYRITKSNNQPGGNKANIDGLAFGPGNLVFIKSPDAMWQDGQWHNWSNSWSFPGIGRLMLSLTFTFDTAGKDPQKSVMRTFE